MTKKSEAENLVRVKTALAEKYKRKAENCTSRPRKAVFFRRAEHYRRQAEDAARG